jgi:aspartate racemase
MADEVEQAISIPLLHIADATAEAIKARGLEVIGLLGTKFTMEENFYRGRLVDRHGLKVIIPETEDREIVHGVIYNELVLGNINPESRNQYEAIIEKLIVAGAQGIILGCTEIGLLVKEGNSRVPLFDTTSIHAVNAVEFALSEP